MLIQNVDISLSMTGLFSFHIHTGKIGINTKMLLITLIEAWEKKNQNIKGAED